MTSEEAYVFASFAVLVTALACILLAWALRFILWLYDHAWYDQKTKKWHWSKDLL